MQRIIVRSPQRITEIHYTYGYATLSADYVCSTYRRTGSRYTYGCATFRITELHYTYGCLTLIDAYVLESYLQNYWVTLHILVSSLKCSL